MGFLSAISNLPGSDDGAALGSATLKWSDLFLAPGGVIDWDDGDVTITHAANALTLAGGQFFYPLGTAGAPSITPVGGTTVGMFFPDTGAVSFATAGVERTRFISGGLATLGLVLRDNVSSPTFAVTFTAESEGVSQSGSDAASPVAQTLKGPDARAGTDTNTVGGNMTIAPGRSTGTGAGGVLYLATSPKGATGTAANALVNRVQLDFEGIAGFSPQDAAATPVEPTAPLKLFAHNKSVADDAVVTLPSVTTCGHGTVHVGGGDPGTAGFPFTNFFVDGSGNVVLLDPTTAADVSANTDTDGDLCIGTADPQEPVQVKNRLAGTKVLNIMFWYD